MSRVIGYGVCAVCRQNLHLLSGGVQYVHATPDLTHTASIKTCDNEWVDQ